ncbi:MAG: NAD-dependent dihydropyrimidine dehydrogenase subunit PreA [Thermodesulfobacteriota bacterium]
MKIGGQRDLSVDFCGIRFKNPFVIASAPPATTGEMIGRAFEAGWAGATTKTLMVEAESLIVNVTPRLASLSFPGPSNEPKKIYAFENIELVTDRSFSVWLKEIEELRKKYPDQVLIASIMDDASKPDGWQYMAKKCAEAGAQIIELNLSCPHGMPELGMGAAIGQDAELAATVTRWTTEAVRIPVMPKMTPNVTDVGAVAKACVEAGASAISGINTVAAIIGVDLETLVPRPNVAGYSAHGGLSGPAVKPIALKAVATMAKAVKVPISALGGISSWEDAAEFLLLGASTLQVCSSVMARGYGIIEDLLDGLGNYMEDKGFDSIAEMVGLSLEKLIGQTELSREVRLACNIKEETCVKCDLCYVSCRDAGYQAIKLKEDRMPQVDREKCTGCSLCQQVCPVWDCVTLTPRESVPA